MKRLNMTHAPKLEGHRNWIFTSSSCILTSIIIMFFTSGTYSQGITCGTDTLEIEFSYFGDPCFSTDTIDAVYINVIVHFFLNDACEGDLAAAPNAADDLNPKYAWILAKKMVDDANNHYVTMSENPDDLNHQWNSHYHGADPSPAHPIPIRYLLRDVLIHCDSDAQSTDVSEDNFEFYLSNHLYYLNIFISDIPFTTQCNCNPNGFFISNPILIVNEHFGSGLFNHEIGHFLGLPHTHGNPNYCDDTWRYIWDWKPCGAPALNSQTTCWNHTPTHNGQNACDDNLFFEEHPCCWWGAQNNNLMTYSSWATNPIYSALTQCQLARALDRLFKIRCDYVEAVNPPCPPVAAISSPVIDEGSCHFCIDLRASMNATSYKLDFYKVPSMDHVSTGWIQGSPSKYCWNTAQKKPGSTAWLNGLLAETEYEMVLTVRNACDESASYERIIETPEDCGTSAYDAIVDVEVVPNPFSGDIQVNYEIFDSAEVLIYVIHPTGGVYSNGFVNEGPKGTGSYAVNFQTSTWTSGHQYLVFLINGIASSTILIKN